MSAADETLYVTDEEMIRRIGARPEVMAPVIRDMDKRSTGFPPKDPLVGGLRYWPSVKAWFDQRHRLKIDTPEANRTRPVRPVPPLRSAS